MTLTPIDSIWTEKYRPKKTEEIVGDFKEKINKYLVNPMSIPNFLFYSTTAGTGKTSLAFIMVKALGCDYIVINSSSDRTMDVIREKVKNFAKSKTSKEGYKRCVILDEVDGMRRESQEALRNTIETYATNCFFIMTCNRINKVVDPIRSRCVEIPFAYPKKEEIYKYIENVCVKEGMDYTEEGLHTLINKKYPSIRNMVLMLQDLKTEGKQVTKENIKNDDGKFFELKEKLSSSDHHAAKKAVMEGTVDPREFNKYLWEHAVKEENIKMIQLTCRNERDFANGCDPCVVMVTSLYEMVK